MKISKELLSKILGVKVTQVFITKSNDEQTAVLDACRWIAEKGIS